MNAQPITTKSTALFGLLFAVSAFNLSALPDHQPTVVSRTISSVKTCDLPEMLNGSDTPNVSCDIKQGELSGKIHLKRVAVTKRDWSDGGEAPVVKTSNEWQLSLETECTEGCEKGTYIKLANNNFESLKDVPNLVREQTAVFEKEAKRVAKEKEEKEELARRKEECEVDSKGKEFASDDKALACKVAHVKKISPREKQAEYFQEQIQPKLQELVTCDNFSGSGTMLSMMPQQAMMGQNQQCATNRNRANQLIKQLAGTAAGNPYIRQAALNLSQFNQYATAMDRLNVLSRYSNDPQAKQYLQQRMGQLQSSWGSYFAQQGLAINQMRSPMDWDSSVLGYNEGLATNLQNYDSAFNNLALQHQQMLGLNTTQNQNALAAGQGRLMRGQTTGYAASPQVVPAGAAANAQPVMSTGAAAQPLVTANRAATPAAGTPNIIKPTVGSSVR